MNVIIHATTRDALAVQPRTPPPIPNSLASWPEMSLWAEERESSVLHPHRDVFGLGTQSLAGEALVARIGSVHTFGVAKRGVPSWNAALDSPRNDIRLCSVRHQDIAHFKRKRDAGGFEFSVLKACIFTALGRGEK